MFLHLLQGKKVGSSPHNLAADLSATASAGLAAVTWVADLNEILQLAATVVAIVAGVAAAWWHIERAVAARRKRLNEDK